MGGINAEVLEQNAFLIRARTADRKINRSWRCGNIIVMIIPSEHFNAVLCSSRNHADVRCGANTIAENLICFERCGTHSFDLLSAEQS